MRGVKTSGQARRWAPILFLAISLSGCTNHRLHLPAFKVNGEGRRSDAFWAGAYKEELTPPPGYPNAGHGPPAAIERGYWSRLYARAFYFRDREGHVAVLVSCDLFAMSGGLWHAVLQEVNARQVYLPPESLTIAATHTHQGPGGFMTASGYNVLASPLPGFDKDLFEQYVKRIADVIVKAGENAVPAKLVLYEGKANIQRNRAIVPFFQNPQMERDAIIGKAQVSCPQDDQLCVRLKAVDNTLLAVEANNAVSGAPLGLMVFYSVHPTALRHDSPLVSADLAGRAMEQLEANSLSPGATGATRKFWPIAGFFNGAEGDMSPDWKDQRYEDVIKLGDALADGVRGLTARPQPDSELTLDSARLEFVNNWHHEKPNLTPKLAAHPTPGAALFGGAEDGRAGILYQLDWHGGILSNVKDCETKLDQGCKMAAIDYPLHEFLKIYGLPHWLNRLPMKLHLTKAAATNGFPDLLPMGWIKFGHWLSLAVLPVEMTTAMASRVRESFPNQHVAIVGLANEYFSYTTTPEEYAKQQYEGASTLSGPQEGPAIIEMLHEVVTCRDGDCRQKAVKAETYHVGPYPSPRFGPHLLTPPHNMVDEDMDPFAREQLAYSETQVPRGEWQEDGGNDWNASGRHVRIMRMDGTSSTLVADESSWNILTVLKTSDGRKRHEGVRVWDALWMLPAGTPRDVDHYFQVTIPGKGEFCSAPFRLSKMLDQMPVPVQSVNLLCPAGK